ncbi:MAG: hypothetical protein ACQES9_09300 [Myxococcota bacterium]
MSDQTLKAIYFLFITGGLLILANNCTDETIIYDSFNHNLNNNNIQCTEGFVGEQCSDDEDCCSGFCIDNICVQKQCLALDEECQTNEDCCSGICNDINRTTSLCKSNHQQCLILGEKCEYASSCCSNNCKDNLCVSGFCLTAAENCTDNMECCSNYCNPETLQCDYPGNCKPAGELCEPEDSAECCSNMCTPGSDMQYRCSFYGFCQPIGEVCLQNDACCSLNCQEGFCAANNLSCLPSGEVCNNSEDCCSENCLQNDYGITVCTSLGGCTPAGEICRNNNDCCSGITGQNTGYCDASEREENQGFCVVLGNCGLPGEMCGFSEMECCGGTDNCQEVAPEVWRCVTPEECLENGESCQNSAECCSGICQDDICQEATCLPTGAACSYSEQCCSEICTPAHQGGVYICQSSCLTAGEVCTTNTDCCSEVCHSFSNICIE